MAHYTELMICLEKSYSASFWLKAAAKALGERDPLNALRDAEELCRIARIRYEESK